MNAKHLWFALLVFGASACSATVSFDRDKISRGEDDGGVPDDASGDATPMQQDDASEPEMDAALGETGVELGCQPGTAGVACEPCKTGQYCAGGSALALPCPEGQWDHDLNPATVCVLQRNCSAGEFVSAMGSTITDRACAPCASGRFSNGANAGLCDGWTTCKVN
jgi:hypothetical protein